MTKLKVLTTALCAAASLTSANADFYHSNLVAADNSQRDWQPFISGSAGYLADAGEDYYLAQLGIATKCDSRFYAQILYSDLSEDIAGISAELEISSISLGATFSKYYDNKNSIYYGGSVGVGNQEISALGGSVDDDMLYFDLTTGFRHDFNDSLSVNLGVRYLYFDEFKVSGVTIADKGDDFGVELGLSFKF